MAEEVTPVEEVAYFERPPLMEDVSIEGPMRIPIPHALDRPEWRERIEVDYNWFRYSKFAAPFLIYLLIVLVGLFGATAMLQVGSLKGLRDGTPRYYQLQIDSDDGYESGQRETDRNVRIAAGVLSGFACFGILAVLALKPRPNVRKGLFGLLMLILLAGAILAIISFGINEKDRKTARRCHNDLWFISNEPCESREGMATAALACDFMLFLFGFATLIFVAMYTATKDFKLLRTGWREQDRDEEQEEPRIAKNRSKGYKIRTTRVLFCCILLSITLALAILAVIFAVLIHWNQRVVELRSFRGRTSIWWDNPAELPFEEAGWAANNTRLRYAYTGIGIITILVNFLPWRSRIVANLFAFVYVCLGVLAMVGFGLDVQDLRDIRDFGCDNLTPYGPNDSNLWRQDVRSQLASRNLKVNCINAPFVATAFWEFVLSLSLFFYVIMEYVLRFKSAHSGRKYPWFQVGKVETALDSQRPVRSEFTSDTHTAAEFNYEIKYTHRPVGATSGGSSSGASSLMQ